MIQYCKNCNQSFDISSEDEAFYSRMGFPNPENCPPCRYQRRLIFRNERNLYRRKCNATGKDIVSIFSEEKRVPVYSQEYWWSDRWNAKSYGRDFDFDRPFFDQFKELLFAVPQLSLNNAQSENCEYTNQSQRNKNCYFIVSSDYSEDCYFGMWYQRCKDCFDCLYLEKSEFCYDVMNGVNCYHVLHSENMESCSDCSYCRDCIGCKNCFGCVNLRNKEYYLFNQPFSKEEYEEKVWNFKMDEAALRDFFSKFPRKYYAGKITENFSGDYVQEVKNCWEVYNVRCSENIKYCTDAWSARNCHDLTETYENDFCFQVEGSAFNVDLAFCMKIATGNSSRYLSHCYSSGDLFACVGLRNSQYCILNKQYMKEEYEALVSRIIDYMKSTGEWGQYFPASLSFFAYNETVAQEYFPLSKEEALKQGYSWKNEEVLPSPQMSDTVRVCEVSGRAFKLIPQELEFYKKMNLPLPSKHPDVRHMERMNRRNPRKLWQRACMRCQKKLISTYPPECPEIVYCEECYLALVY